MHRLKRKGNEMMWILMGALLALVVALIIMNVVGRGIGRSRDLYVCEPDGYCSDKCPPFQSLKGRDCPDTKKFCCALDSSNTPSST